MEGNEAAALLLSLENVEIGSGSSNQYGTANLCAQSPTSIEPKSNHTEDEVHTWLVPFFINIFLACASFSIIMPSLAPYILEIGAPLSLLPWVVSCYSVGEMVGSSSIGVFYEYATRTFKVEGRGPRTSLLLCAAFGISGSALYAVAGWVNDVGLAQQLVLYGRFLQGVWTGGQQAVEQAYLSAAVLPSVKVEMTATLSTCAVLGFVMGPSIGAIFCAVDTTIYGLHFNANNAPGFLILVASCIMFLQTLLFFDGRDDHSGRKIAQEIKCKHKSSSDTTEHNNEQRPFNTTGVLMSIFLFLVHYYSFAVQETITTPMVMRLYDWSPFQINLLFVGSGIISLITSFMVRYISRYIQDQTLLLSSIVIGLLGSTCLIDVPQLETVLPVWRFLLGFSLVTMAFPLGRNVVLGVFGNILGPVNQGRWMGVIIAVSAFPRALGPFLALEALEIVNWHTWLEFGLCSVLFLLALVGTIESFETLVPYSEFVNGLRKEGCSSHVLVPSPVLARQNSAASRKHIR